MRNVLRRPAGAAGAAATAALLASTLAVTPASAAPNNNNSAKLRAAVTLEGVERHLRALQSIADANGANRYAGLPGYEKSADYVAQQLRAAGYSPTFQSFVYNDFREQRPAQLSQVTPTATTFVNGTDFTIASYSGSGTVEARLAVPTGDLRGCRATDFTSAVAGTLVLVQRGAPADFTTTPCTFGLKAANAFAAGAAGVLIYNNVEGLLNGTLGAGPLAAGPVVGLSLELGAALREQVLAGTPTTFSISTDTVGGPRTTRNVLAELPGKSGDQNVVMVGAHLDSVAAGPGINDNGSGSAGILETAIQLAKTRPENTVRFAWWSAEESGLVGSNYYVDSLTQAERDKIALYLNFDMIGSPNYARFVYDGDNDAFPVGTGVAAGPAGSDQIEALFEDYFASQGLASEPTPFSGRSDYGRFIAFGIPAGGLFTGAEGVKTAAQAAKFGGTAGVAYDPCYHQACDTIANVNRTGLDEMSDAVAHAVISYAQSTQAVNGVRGKGNFNRPATGGTGAGSGTAEGGGLHDHDHEELEAA